MRIAVVEFAARGGLIHYAFQVCRALAAAGAEVTLVTARHYELGDLPHAFHLEKLLRLWDPKPAGPLSQSLAARLRRRLRRLARAAIHYREWLRLVRYLRRWRPDVVQLGDIRFATDLLPLTLLRRAGLRLADVCHNVQPFAAGRGLPRRSRLLRGLFARIYRLFDVVFVHYETNRGSFLSLFGLDPARVVAIPHGNEAVFAELRRAGVDAPAMRRRMDLAPGDRVILFFGTLSRYKGVDVLLAALPRLLEQEPRARAVIAGFPAPDFDPADCQRLIARLGVQEVVRLLPQYVASDEVAAWMELGEVAVFPYQTVTQSGALHLAHTFGVPIVATRVGAIPEVVTDGETGLLVPAEDPEALACAVARILADRDLAARLSRQAREEAGLRFAWDGVARTMLDRYRALVAAPGGFGAAVPGPEAVHGGSRPTP